MVTWAADLTGLPTSMRSRRDIIVFLALTVVLSFPFYGYLLLARDPSWNPMMAAAFMWCPGMAAIAAKLVSRRPLGELGWRWRRTHRYLAGVVGLPLACGLAVYALVWISGLGRFSLERITGAVSQLWQGWTPSSSLVITVLIVVAPVRILSGSPRALGEELGWRGLLAPRLAEWMSPAKASLLTGAVWALWHYPLVLVLLPRLRPGLPRGYALACFTATVVGVSFVYSWVRLRSGSVWPAVFLHSASMTAQDMLEALTQDTGRTQFLTYEYGVGFTVVVVLILAAFWGPLTRRAAAEQRTSPAGT